MDIPHTIESLTVSLAQNATFPPIQNLETGMSHLGTIFSLVSSGEPTSRSSDIVFHTRLFRWKDAHLTISAANPPCCELNFVYCFTHDTTSAIEIRRLCGMSPIIYYFGWEEWLLVATVRAHKGLEANSHSIMSGEAT
jgi:hypothetical protein